MFLRSLFLVQREKIKVANPICVDKSEDEEEYLYLTKNLICLLNCKIHKLK